MCMYSYIIVQLIRRNQKHYGKLTSHSLSPSYHLYLLIHFHHLTHHQKFHAIHQFLGSVSTPSAADNISVSNPFDDPIVGGNAPPSRTGPPYQSGVTGAGGGGSGSSVSGGVGGTPVGSGPTGAPYPPIPNTASSRPPQGTTLTGLLRLFFGFVKPKKNKRKCVPLLSAATKNPILPSFLSFHSALKHNSSSRNHKLCT